MPRHTYRIEERDAGFCVFVDDDSTEPLSCHTTKESAESAADAYRAADKRRRPTT